MENELRKYEYIIVGQGLAGSILAYHLLEAGQKVAIFNDETLPTSSSVAAGIYNPVTGKRLKKAWLIDKIFPFLEKFYSELENKFSIPLLHRTKIYRPFDSTEQQNYFLSQTENAFFEQYMNDNVDNNRYESLIFNELGGLETLLTGWVDIPILLKELRQFFVSQKAYFPEKYKPENLKLGENQVIYKGFTAQKIIFAEGFYGFQNPFFSWLPHNAVKGEILNAKIEKYNIEEIINQGIFILPIEKGICRIGATYNWDELNFQTTEEGKLFLTQKADKLLRVPYEIIGHQAGVRPSTDDRRPFIGLHPRYPNVGIFNGLGTKGVSLAPYFANQLTEFLVNGKDLIPEVNIERFYSLL